MCPPRHYRSLVGIVAPIVVLRHLYVVTLSHVTLVLLVKGVRSVFQVSRNEEFPSVACHDDTHSAFLRLCYHGQAVVAGDVVTPHLRMTAVRHGEYIVETTEDGQRSRQRVLWEDAEHLFLQRVFRDVVEMV